MPCFGTIGCEMSTLTVLCHWEDKRLRELATYPDAKAKEMKSLTQPQTTVCHSVLTGQLCRRWKRPALPTGETLPSSTSPVSSPAPSSTRRQQPTASSIVLMLARRFWRRLWQPDEAYRQRRCRRGVRRWQSEGNSLRLTSQKGKFAFFYVIPHVFSHTVLQMCVEDICLCFDRFLLLCGFAEIFLTPGFEPAHNLLTYLLYYIPI